MTVTQMRTRVYARLDDDGTYYPLKDFYEALNEAQRFFVLVTLCLEKTVNLPLTADQVHYHLLQQTGFTDFLLPLRIRILSGARVLPGRLSDFDAGNEDWQTTSGTPDYYALNGFDFLSLNKQPSSPGTSLAITYAHAPATVANDNQTIEVPAECHPDLLEYIFHRMRLPEGGKELLDTLPKLQGFIAKAQSWNNFVRQRSKANRYDRFPAELSKVDLSQVFRFPKRPRRGLLNHNG